MFQLFSPPDEKSPTALSDDLSKGFSFVGSLDVFPRFGFLRQNPFCNHLLPISIYKTLFFFLTVRSRLVFTPPPFHYGAVILFSFTSQFF